MNGYWGCKFQVEPKFGQNKPCQDKPLLFQNLGKTVACPDIAYFVQTLVLLRICSKYSNIQRCTLDIHSFLIRVINRQEQSIESSSAPYSDRIAPYFLSWFWQNIHLFAKKREFEWFQLQHKIEKGPSKLLPNSMFGTGYLEIWTDRQIRAGNHFIYNIGNKIICMPQSKSVDVILKKYLSRKQNILSRGVKTLKNVNSVENTIKNWFV